MKGVHHEKESKEKSEKDRTTISKEIRNHCFVKPFRGNNEVNCSLLLNLLMFATDVRIPLGVNNPRCSMMLRLLIMSIIIIFLSCGLIWRLQKIRLLLSMMSFHLLWFINITASITAMFPDSVIPQLQFHADLSASIQAFPVCNRSLYALEKVIGGFWIFQTLWSDPDR